MVQRATQMDTIIGLAAANLGNWLVPEPLAFEEASDVKFRRPAKYGTPGTYEVALAWRSTDSNPTVAALVDSCAM